jgi:hypothetical protein
MIQPSTGKVMKMNLSSPYAASFASLGVITVIIAFTIQVSIEQHQLNNRQDAPALKVAALQADSSIKNMGIVTTH